MGMPALLQELDQIVNDVLQQGLAKINVGGRPLRIVFGLPQKDKVPDAPTVSVFLYDIHEDLQRRNGEARSFNPATGELEAQRIHICCCYLVSYWDRADKEYGPLGKDNVSRAIDAALRALLSLRLAPELERAHIQVIPPSEHVGSLGNFWQSLDDRPRRCLNYTITVPFELPIDNKPITAVQLPTVNLVRKVGTTSGSDFWDRFSIQIGDKLRKLVASKLGLLIIQARQQLRRVSLQISSEHSKPVESSFMVTISTEGVASARVRHAIPVDSANWHPFLGSAACTVDGYEIFAEKVTSKVIAPKAPT